MKFAVWLFSKKSVMSRILCVAEKNDAAKNIANLLSRGQCQRTEGHSKFNKIYRFDCQFRGQLAHFVMTSVSGHLETLEFTGPYREWRLGAISTLFEAPITRMINPNMLPIGQTLKEQAQRAQILIIWTDCDREGENIGAEIRSACLEGNPNLDVYRAIFSEITGHAVYRALNNVVRLDDRKVDAVNCRSELDLRIGAAFTRLQTLHLQKTLPTITEVVSYGSCQFPTLGFVVERYKSIKEFIPEPFWRLVGHHKRENQQVQFLWQRNRLFDQDVVDMLLDECKEVGHARVINVQKKPKNRWRPVALDTVELEKLAVRKLRISAKEAMSAAERLYSQGYISYPRTETNIFPKELPLGPLVECQGNNNEWGQFAVNIMQRGGPVPKNGRKTDQAHPPIHPLKAANRGEIARDWAIYELIVRHFLACVSRDATGQETNVEVNIADEIFKANGIIIEDKGYLEVYIYDKWTAKILPAYQHGEILKDFDVKKEESKTSPPQLLNEADLIALMDKHGIGTDATHAEHIEKIKERQYVTLNNDKRFIPGFLGLALVDTYNEMGYEMSKPKLRSNLESQLLEICNGTKTKEDVLREQLRCYKSIFQRTEDRIMLLSDIFRRYLQERRGAPPVANQQPLRQHPPAASRQRPQPGAHQQPRTGHNGSRPSSTGRGNAPLIAVPNGFQPQNNTIQFQPTRNVNPPQPNNVVNCKCGMPSVIRTANTAANKGRQFFACPKLQNDPAKCNFFQWIT